MRHVFRTVAGAVGLTTMTLGLAGVALPTAMVPATTATKFASQTAPNRTAGGPLLIENGRPRIASQPVQDNRSAFAPPTDAQCQADTGVAECFTPQNIRTAYGLHSLLATGDEGKGQTIVIVDSFGSPTIQSDLRSFDQGYKIVNPPSFRILSPLGTVKWTDNNAQSGWAEETTLDVEWSHAIAPLAKIVLLTSPVNETEGTAGLGDFLKLEQYALNHKLGDIISQSWAATENTLETSAGRTLVAAFEKFYARADRHHITVLASSGDTGTQNAMNASGSRNYRQPTVNFPSSSPLITAVGGTSLSATRSGAWSAETVWNDNPAGGAGGGGISQLFTEPAYQKSLPASVQTLLKGHRGLPDVSWNADPDTSILIYSSFGPPGDTGYSPIGGTSEGSPQWAGLIADVDQARGNAIGFLNPTLYALASYDSKYFHDIVTGNNAYDGVRGYEAVTGWDPASGLGTPRAAALLAALVKAPAQS